MPKIIIPLCENLFSWAFHVFIIFSLRPHGISHGRKSSQCVTFLSCLISSVYNLFFKGHMPACSRTGNLAFRIFIPVCDFLDMPDYLRQACL
jgi:hypothetical protein